MKVALVHDYLNQMGGAERVVMAFHEMFPDAPIYTSIYDPERVDPAFRTMDIRTTWFRSPFRRTSVGWLQAASIRRSSFGTSRPAASCRR